MFHPNKKPIYRFYRYICTYLKTFTLETLLSHNLVKTFSAPRQEFGIVICLTILLTTPGIVFNVALISSSTVFIAVRQI